MGRAPIIWDLNQVCDHLGVSRVTVYRWITAKGFPAPHKVYGSRKNHWEKREVLSWMKSQ